MRANQIKSSGPSKPPNIVLIIVDDMGYNDLGRHTPRLNAMTTSGIRLTNFYVTAPICTPTRSALLTGRHQIRTGLTRALFPDDPEGLSHREITLPEVLRWQGYATAIVGKWHLGDRLQYLPTRHGFDRFFGVPYSNDMSPFVLMRDEVINEQEPDQATLTQRFTTEAQQFISEAVESERPFFLYFPHTLLHTPLFVLNEPVNRAALYAAALEELDNSVGTVLDHLYFEGVDDDTIVVFLSDNGPAVDPSPPDDTVEPWRWVGGDAGSLKDGKHTLWEGGVRVPFMARWPSRIRPRTFSDEPASVLDLFPTLISLAGGVVPGDRDIDGEDISNVLTGRGARPGESFFFFYHPSPKPGAYPIAVRSGSWKLHLERNFSPAELYDLASDPSELNPQDAPDIAASLADKAWRFYRFAVASSTDNLAQNRPTVASSEKSDEGNTKEKAVDGSIQTYWASEYEGMPDTQADDQWITVDLGVTSTVNAVVLRWGPAYAKKYVIEISKDASTWNTIFRMEGGTGAVDYIHGLLGNGQHIRVRGIERGTAQGYSLRGIEVYALGPGAPPNLALNRPVAASSWRKSNLPQNAVSGDTSVRWSSEWSDDQWFYVDLGSVKEIGQIILHWEAAYGKKYEIQVSNDATAWTTVYSEKDGAGGTDLINGLNVRGRYVRLKGVERGTQWGYSLWEFEIYAPATRWPTNLALNRPISASSYRKENHPQNAVDGDLEKRWSSEWSDDQWISVDLGGIKSIARVVLRWENAYGKEYQILVSADGSSWTTIHHERNGQGGVDDIKGLSASGRYVRMQGIKRGTQWGYSLWEFEVYGG